MSKAFLFPESDSSNWKNEWTPKWIRDASILLHCFRAHCGWLMSRERLKSIPKLTDLEKLLFLSWSPLLRFSTQKESWVIFCTLALFSCLSVTSSKHQKVFPFLSVRNCSYVISIFWGTWDRLVCFLLVFFSIGFLL